MQIKHYTEGNAKDQGLEEGDVLVTNHPQLAGGSHLPDITIITPVFNEDKIVFFVASRGHHADVGGITPGSMPPHSHCLAEEGAAILSFKVVNDGVFQVRTVLLPTGPISCCLHNNLLAGHSHWKLHVDPISVKQNGNSCLQKLQGIMLQQNCCAVCRCKTHFYCKTV